MKYDLKVKYDPESKYDPTLQYDPKSKYDPKLKFDLKIEIDRPFWAFWTVQFYFFVPFSLTPMVSDGPSTLFEERPL